MPSRTCPKWVHPAGSTIKKTPAVSRRGFGLQGLSSPFGLPARYGLVTLAACGPLGPSVISNSTRSPSLRERKPSILIALKCTNTSGPPSCAMNPYPFASLNHFTVPCATSLYLLAGLRRQIRTHATARHLQHSVPYRPPWSVSSGNLQ